MKYSPQTSLARGTTYPKIARAFNLPQIAHIWYLILYMIIHASYLRTTTNLWVEREWSRLLRYIAAWSGMLQQHYQTRAVISTRLNNFLPQSNKDRSFIQHINHQKEVKSHWKLSKTHWRSAGPQFEAKAFEFALTISCTQLQNVWYVTFQVSDSNSQVPRFLTRQQWANSWHCRSCLCL